MAFYLNDRPAEAFVIEPPENIDLGEFETATAVLLSPAGGSTGLTATIEGADGVIEVDQPSSTAFTTEGLYRLRVVLATPSGRSQQLPDARIVVQDADSQWHNLDTARSEWPDAGHLADAVLWELLEVARHDVTAYAPQLGESVRVPLHYRKGQVMHARNILNSIGVDPSSGEDGGDTFAIRPFPLDWQVKQILRPKRGIPVVA